MSPTPTPPQFATRPQPKIAPKAPETRQDAAKEAFLDVVFNAKSMGMELVDDFRASDRFFKYKVSVLVGWVLLTIAALYVSYPRFDSEPSNDLDARILIKQVPALDKQLTALYIENRSGKDWGDTLLKVNNTYTHALADLKADAKQVVTLNKFSGPDGATPPPDLKLQKLEITCAQGHTEIDLVEIQNPKQ
jgi:hypothetical protein